MRGSKSLTRDITNKLIVQRRNIGRTGLIDLQNMEIPTLTQIGIQSKLRKLNVSGSNLTSFETLPPQPILSKIIANNTKIDSYVGLSRHSRLSSLSLKNTPISQRPNFRLEALIAVGQHLTTLNGEAITLEERNAVAEYPLIAQDLIDAGWDLVYPCPDVDTFRELAVNYGLRFKGVDKNFTNENSEKYFKPPPQIPVYNSMYETAVSVATKEVNDSSVIEKKKIEDLALDKEMMEAIALELKRIGVYIPDDDNMEENIVSAVQNLAEIIQTLDPCADELLKLTQEL